MGRILKRASQQTVISLAYIFPTKVTSVRLITYYSVDDGFEFYTGPARVELSFEDDVAPAEEEFEVVVVDVNHSTRGLAFGIL